MTSGNITPLCVSSTDIVKWRTVSTKEGICRGNYSKLAERKYM
jgi:hypothetical protein